MWRLLYIGGGINNKTIDLTPYCCGAWVIDKEDAIVGNKKNVHFSNISFFQLANLADDLDKGDFSRFPIGGDVLNKEAIDNFLYTKVAPSFGLRFKGLKGKDMLTVSEQYITEYWMDSTRFLQSTITLSGCFAPSAQGISQYLIVDTQPTKSGKYLYYNKATGENELIVID